MQYRNDLFNALNSPFSIISLVGVAVSRRRVVGMGSDLRGIKNVHRAVFLHATTKEDLPTSSEHLLAR